MRNFKGKGWRKIVVGDQEYRWRYGHGMVIVRSFVDGKTVARKDPAKMLGLDPNEFERGVHKRWAMILPSHVHALILEQAK